ncbi:MAG: ABC transporter permease [Polyangiaceae bacterium]|nr:ABC transporter permease [Myxococcales bacterium]MCB9589861.1 ABC transporter permease [Polyangiaceae bacterium]
MTTAAVTTDSTNPVVRRIQDIWRSRPSLKLRRDRFAMVCLVVISLYMLIAALVALGVIGGDFADRVGTNYQSPNGETWKHWLGTDRQGRSIIVRMLYSTKVAFNVGFVSALIGSVVGSLTGAIAGYFGKTTDTVVVWLYSTIQSIPNLLLLIALSYAVSRTDLGRGLIVVYIAFGATFWVGPCRVVRGEVLKLRESDYVQAARAMGYSHARILLLHVLPNTLHLVLVYFALLFVAAIKSEVILSYLGLGVQGEPSWGVMINQSRAELINGYYWQIGAATLAMLGLVLCFNVFADALQDALDPKSL